MAVRPEDFFNRLEDSGLLGDSIADHRNQILQSASAEDAAAELVHLKLLTEFQGEVLVSDDQIPLVIGDYVVTDSIGRGGMGYVLKARHRRMKRPVAIKFLLKSLTESDDLQRRFEREVEAAAQLDHQNIVTAYDAGVHDGSHYLVMQYVDGEDLSHLVKSAGPLDIADAVDVIRQAALGLGYAHDRGIIHRDIKPGNLLLDNDGVVRILDMGLARMLPSPGDALEGGAQADLTNTGSVMGTIDYMAPEQALDSKSVDHRTDIYALGCTLYFLLTGNPPFRNDTVMRRLLAHREQPAPRISEYRPEAPRELDQIFAMMMAKSPDDRFPSMKHLVVALDSIELTDLDDEQMATLDMPADGNGGFVRQSEDDSIGLSNTAETFVTPDRPSASDATILEPSSQPLVGRANSDGSTTSLDADFSGAGDTIVKRSSARSGKPGNQQPTAQLPWKLIVPGILAIVALIAFVATRPGSSNKTVELPAPNSIAADSSGGGLPASSERPENPPNQSPDRRAAERVLALGGTISIRRESSPSQEPVSELPDEPFDLVAVQISSTEATDDDLKYLQGLKSLTGISMWDTEITDQGLANLTDSGRVPLPSLGTLYAQRLEITDEGIGFLAGCNGLYRLSLSETQVSELELVCRALPNVSQLDIERTGISGESLAALNEFPKLQSLSVSGSQLRNGGSRHVAELKGLKRLVVFDASEGFEAGVLTNLSSLEYLDVREVRRVPLSADFWPTVNGLPRLAEIGFDGWGVKSEFVEQIPAMSQLRTLTIGHSHADGAAIANAAKKLPQLESLDLNYNERLDDDGLKHLTSLTSLKRLNLSGNVSLSAAGIESLHQALPGCRIVSDHGTFEPDGTPNLSTDRRAAEWVLSVGGEIWIRTANMPRAGVRELPDEPFDLLRVVLSGTGFTDEGLINLRGLESLSELEFLNTGLTDRGLAMLTDSGRVPLGNLKRLMAINAEISDTGIGYLASSTMLNYVIFDGTRISSLELIVSSFPRLATLKIAGTKIPGESLDQLDRLSRLNNLEVSGQQFESGHTHISKLPNLRMFCVQGRSSSFNGTILAKMSGLESLTLYSPLEQQLGDEFWSTVSKLSKLKAIGLYGFGGGLTSAVFNRAQTLEHIESLIMDHTDADGASIASAVSKFPRLRFLGLSFGAIDDAGLKYFTDLKQIRSLKLTGCKKLSAAAIQALHQALPNCRIESDHGTFEPVAPTTVSRDRRAAEWVLSLDGTVSIRNANDDGASVIEIAGVPDEAFDLQEVSLANTEATDDGLANLRGLSHLASFDISQSNLTDLGLKVLTDSGRLPLPSLKKLTVEYSDVSDTGLSYLTGSSHLEAIYANNSKVASVDQLVVNFPKLNILKIADTHVSGKSLGSLETASNLRILEISGTQFDAGRAHVEKLTRLERFSMWGKSVVFDGSVFAKMPNLQALTVTPPSNQQGQEVFWSTISSLLQLKEIRLGGYSDGLTSATFDGIQPLSRLELFVATHTRADGATIARAISKFPRLQRLVLDEGVLDDAGLKQFNILTQLRDLSLMGCRELSAAAIQSLHNSLPNCRIVSDHGTFEPASL